VKANGSFRALGAFAALVVGAAVVPLTALSGCGEEGKAIGDACEDIPLFQLVYDEDAKAWVRVDMDGEPLSAEDNARIDEETSRGRDGGARCITPVGTAVSSTAGGAPGTGGTSGTGGASASGGASQTGGASASGGASNDTDAGTDGGAADGGTPDGG
jgi:hypothetical protein